MNLKQLVASYIMKMIQKYGSHKVQVLGKTYVVSKEVFNPKFYYTSEFMANHINVTPEDEVLDIGTGSGIQAITAGQVARKVVAIDINPEAVRCARENVKRNGLENTILVLRGNLFSPLTPGSMFDVILFTPPYMEGRPKTAFDHAIYDPKKSLAKRFFKEAKKYLKRNGYIQMVYSSMAEPESVLKIASDIGWEHSVITQKRVLFETFIIYKLTLSNLLTNCPQPHTGKTRQG